jgi:hypothetical protein
VIQRTGRRRGPGGAGSDPLELRLPSTNFRGAAIMMAGEPGRAPIVRQEDPIMEIAAVVLFSSVLLWLVEALTEGHA